MKYLHVIVFTTTAFMASAAVTSSAGVKPKVWVSKRVQEARRAQPREAPEMPPSTPPQRPKKCIPMLGGDENLPSPQKSTPSKNSRQGTPQRPLLESAIVSRRSSDIEEEGSSLDAIPVILQAPSSARRLFSEESPKAPPSRVSPGLLALMDSIDAEMDDDEPAKPATIRQAPSLDDDDDDAPSESAIEVESGRMVLSESQQSSPHFPSPSPVPTLAELLKESGSRLQARILDYGTSHHVLSLLSRLHGEEEEARRCAEVEKSQPKTASKSSYGRIPPNLFKGFTDKDWDMHRRYQEELNRESAARMEKFRRELRLQKDA